MLSFTNMAFPHVFAIFQIEWVALLIIKNWNYYERTQTLLLSTSGIITHSEERESTPSHISLVSASPTGVDAEAVFDPTIQTKPKGMSLFKRKTKTPEPDPTPPESDVDTPRPQDEEG